MDRNTLIGMVLLFGLFYLWATMNAPSEEELARQKFIEDSIAQVETVNSELDEQTMKMIQDTSSLKTDSVNPVSIAEKTFTLENDVAEYVFSTKGGKLINAHLKNFNAIKSGAKDEDVKTPLKLMNDNRNTIEYIIPTSQGNVNTGKLNFQASQNGNNLEFTASVPGGGKVIQSYSLEDGYLIDYNMSLKEIPSLNSGDKITLNWIDYLNKLEKNHTYELYYATQYYKVVDETPTYLSTQSEDTETINENLKWVSHSNQFFNSTLIADKSFDKAILDVAPTKEDSSLIFTQSEIVLKVDNPRDQRYEMEFFIGPNDFEILKEVGHETSDIVPFGWSIFGTINRWIIRPVFNFLHNYIGSLGIVILVLTFIIKMALYPLTYKMLKSQTMMGGLKDRIKALKEKYKDDSQTQQMETMKLYREYGVNPLGGCLPMVLQMPIWFALYRFFPASIQFRQEPFLWANDLSSYDVFWHLPYNIPFYGSHVSLFTLLWAVSLFGYTWYNMNKIDVTQANMNPMMKYMQLVMPVMFLFFLNSYASGLTAYLLFSNLINIAQTLITKNFIFHDEKIQTELNKNKEKPKKKKGGFQQKLQEIMEEQKRVQEQQKKKK